MWEQNWTYWVGRPRTADGLLGIVLSPWLHGSWEHLISNSLAFSMLGLGVFVLYPSLAEKVVWTNFFLTGILVWLLARPSYHIGASGWVYSLAGFLFFSGIFRRDRRSLIISLTIVLLYAGMLETVFPNQKTISEHISWESHLLGGLVGAVMAFSFRKDVPDQNLKLEEELMEDTSHSGYEKEGVIPMENEYFVYHYKENQKVE